MTQNRVFSYNFAVPNVIRADTYPDPRSAAYNNIINFCNWKDVVTHIPNNIKWERYGEDKNIKFYKDIIFWGDPTPGVLFGAHRAELYQKWVYAQA